MPGHTLLDGGGDLGKQCRVEYQRLDLRGLENIGVVVQGAQRVQRRARYSR